MRVLLGCVDAHSGDFVLASVRYEQMAISVDGDHGYVGFAVVRKRQWADMVELLNKCWEYAGNSLVPSSFPREGDMADSDHLTALQKFQEIFHKLAMDAVGAQRTGPGNLGEGVWSLEEDVEHRWGDESEDWIT